ncbi:hypothetical protein PG999_004449 [Apiospora kogelbergensis]|uniref:BHLH domain-containing protein n=1 Tax=Apiospora kogelbergensis TaxID=1337665 RepID=A0AAW0QZA3_9PEZI
MPFSQLSSPPPIDDDMYYSSRLSDPLPNLGSDYAPLLTAVPMESLLPHLEEPIVSDTWMASFLDMPHADFVLFPDFASPSTVSDVQDGQATPWREAIHMSFISPTSVQAEESTLLSGCVAADLLLPDPPWSRQNYAIGRTGAAQKQRGQAGPPPLPSPPAKVGPNPVPAARRQRAALPPSRQPSAPRPRSGPSGQQHVHAHGRGRPLDHEKDGEGDGDNGKNGATDKKTKEKTKKKKKGQPANQKPVKVTKANVVCRALAYIEQLDQEYMEWEAKNTRAASMIVRHYWALVNKPANTFTM